MVGDLKSFKSFVHIKDYIYAISDEYKVPYESSYKIYISLGT